MTNTDNCICLLLLFFFFSAPYTKYGIQVSAFTRIGSGPKSDIPHYAMTDIAGKEQFCVNALSYSQTFIPLLLLLLALCHSNTHMHAHSAMHTHTCMYPKSPITCVIITHVIIIIIYCICYHLLLILITKISNARQYELKAQVIQLSGAAGYPKW